MLAKASLASSLRTFSLLIASLETARAVAAALMRRRRSAVLFTPPRFLPDPVRAPPWWAMVTLKISRAHVAPLRGSDLIGCALLGSPVGSSTRRRRCHASWRGRNVLKLNIGQKPLNFHGYGWERRRRPNFSIFQHFPDIFSNDQIALAKSDNVSWNDQPPTTKALLRCSAAAVAGRPGGMARSPIRALRDSGAKPR